jgi:hypothetical protein
MRVEIEPTAGLRVHDLRHHAITELAESQTTDQTIMSIAGHVSPKMLAHSHYSHVRLEAKRNALEAIAKPAPHADEDRGQERKDSGCTERGYVTSHVTTETSAEIVPAELLERYGRHVGTRTPDLYRVKVALLGFTETYKCVEVA